MHRAIAAALFAIAGTPAVACSFVPSEKSWAEQVAAEERIFIGTLLMLDPDNRLALFSVDEAIRGIDRKWIELPLGDGANCTHLYAEAGAQWIYAGDFIGGPTREISTPLDDEELAALALVRGLAE